MRHRVKGKKLRRSVSHRKATIKALTTSLFRYKRIKTTVAKAKETRVFAERLITKAKVDNFNNRRYVGRYIKEKDAVLELFNEIGPKVVERNGGYTRVVKLGNRLGDSAELAILELVDFGEVSDKEPKETKAEKVETVEEKEEVVSEEKVEDAEVTEEVEDKKKDEK